MLWSRPEDLRYATDSYRVATKAQQGRAKTRFLYLGGGANPHRQGRSPENRTRTQRKGEPPKPHRDQPDPLRLVHALNGHVAPLGLLVVAAASHAGPHYTLLVARHLEGGVGKDAGGHDVLLHEADEQHHLRTR